MVDIAPQRTLLWATDTETFRKVTSDWLLHAADHEVDLVRKNARESTNRGETKYACGKCGYSVYLQSDLNRRPLWAHRPGAPKDCDWWTGEPTTEENTNANKFQGNQETQLHMFLKKLLGDLLIADSMTEPESVIVDKYLIVETGNRRPDVRATYNSMKIALEIQLSTTLLPTIVNRREFYIREGRHLVWLTYEMDIESFSDLKMAFRDIYFDHSQCLFSVDQETIEISKARSRLFVRANWWRKGKRQSKVVSLTELYWPDNALPYMFPPVSDKLQLWRTTWIAESDGYKRMKRCEKVGTVFASDSKLPINIDWWALSETISCLLSILVGKPVHSEQTNLIEKLNSYLSSGNRQCFASLLRMALRFSPHRVLLSRSSLQKKLLHAEEQNQLLEKSFERRLIAELFPEW